MRKIYLLFIFIISSLWGIGQSPNLINYQGVARNSVGNVLPNQAISVRLSIRDLTAGGTIVYSETRSLTTNFYGLFSIAIGSAGATNVTGTMGGVNWAVGSKFLQVEFDPAGGTVFTTAGTTQLLSVPYALYSTSSGSSADMVLPFSKTQSNNGTLFKLTNSGTSAGSTAIEGLTNSTSGNAFAVIGTVTSTAPGGFSAGVRGINNGTGGLGIGVWGSQAGSGWGVYGTALTGIGVNGTATDGIGVNGGSNTGTGGRFTSTSGLALYTTGGVRFEGIGEGVNRVLTSDALGNATWQSIGSLSGITGSGTLNYVSKWTPDGTQIGNSLLFDDGSNVGIGTITPSHRFTVVHGGATGIKSQSAAGSGSFSVIDIDADNGDAALRFQKAGAGQWNIRNRPADDYLEFFELGGGGSRMVIQDGTGNVGIGETTAPSYKLDVLHGGATGIRSRSSATFSVIDIDADNGDAALRFQKAGTGQWNTRNRPADDYYEIFELGGGGSRFVIQDGTGNVGIGETTAPSYKLDVLHGGATGIRSRSSSTFSVIDIDADNGDAALRFQKAGTGQWNTRNRPADDYYEIFELGGGGSRFVIQDGTGNVGIGETSAPSYKLDVLHEGASGIRSRSSSTFSLVDIDAANGDAALRFQKAGVGQWNTRNRPADDYYEIFELGGGGSRFVIQDGTGNVGIGESANPTYKLDVLHGGATGIRSRSSGTFSLMDIDAANGDAALRFAKAGVNQWNIRNNPATDDLQIFELGGGGERMRIENTTGRVFVDGDLHVNGTLSKSAGAFKIDDPLDPANKYLIHSFVESPDMMNIYNGNITTGASNKATVKLPEYFDALNKDFRYQLTVIGSFAQAIISKEVSGNTFEIETDKPNVKVSWQVTGVRNDPYAQANRIPNVVEKDAKDKGKYLVPEVYGKPQSMRIGYTKEVNPSSNSLNNVPQQIKKAAPPTDGGSLDQIFISKQDKKKPEISGSVLEVKTVEKKVEAKAEIKGTSVEDIKKTSEEKKVKTTNDPGSTKD